MRRPTVRCWSANGKTAEWRSVTVAGDYVMKKSRRARPSSRRPQPPDRGSSEGCRCRRRPATHGENLINKCGHKGRQRNERRELWKWRSGGKRGNPKAGFPLFPPLLGNLAKNARFPHSHSSDDETVKKWKTKSRFPTFPPPFLLRLRKKNTADC